MKIKNIKKSYGNNQVLNDISFELKAGAKVALLGNNGAGKSTLMNIINGNVKASSGKIEYGKMKPTSNNTGYIMQNMTLPPDALVSEVLALFSNDEQSKEYGLKLVKEFKMESYLRQRFSNLSGGQKQKLFLVSALQNSPEYFFLDEITTGLDSESRGELFKLLSSNLKVKNSTLLLVTHYLEEALQLCDRFIILKDGKIIDTIVRAIAGCLMACPAFLQGPLMFLANMAINFFIPSGSGQAAAVMPLMTPVADLIGMTRQTSVLAFNLGDGLCNYILPHSSALMANLMAAGIGYDKWMKFMGRIFLVWILLSCLAMAAAQWMNYGPF